jgi:hypothetical protein
MHVQQTVANLPTVGVARAVHAASSDQWRSYATHRVVQKPNALPL